MTPEQSRALAAWLQGLGARSVSVRRRLASAPGRQWETLTPTEQREAMAAFRARRPDLK